MGGEKYGSRCYDLDHAKDPYRSWWHPCDRFRLYYVLMGVGNKLLTEVEIRGV